MEAARGEVQRNIEAAGKAVLALDDDLSAEVSLFRIRGCLFVLNVMAKYRIRRLVT